MALVERGHLSKVLEQNQPSASLCVFSKAAELVDAFDPLCSCSFNQVFHKELAFEHGEISRLEEHYALRRQPVSSSATNLLVVLFDCFWRAIVHNVADVRLVNTHTKCCGCADNFGGVGREVFVSLFTLLKLKPGVVH